MANSDGSLIFDTELDNEGFKRGSAKLERAMQHLVKEAERIGDVMQKGFSTPKQMGSFQSKIDSARKSVAQLESQINELGQQTISTADYENVTKAIEKAEKALFKLYAQKGILEELGVDESSTQWRRLQIQIRDAEAELVRFEKAKKSMEASGQAFVSGSETEEYQRLSTAIADVTDRLNGYQAAAQQVKMGGTAGKISLLKTALEKVGKAAKGAVSWLKKFLFHSNKSALSAKDLLKPLLSLKSMLFTRAKRMFISYIFDELKDAMTALQKYSSAFGSAMNNMKNSCKMLGANLSVTFGNLVAAIEPAVTQIVNIISTAITHLNAFFALLSGKSTMTVAKKQMKDYTKETDGAAKAAKELNKQLMGFDEINRMNAPDETMPDTDGTKPEDLFEEAPIDSILPDSVKNFFQQLKSAFESGDWEQIGSIIAGGLNRAMAAIDGWITGTLGPTAVDWASRIARALNGLVSEIDWALMGKLLADGLNALFGTIGTIISTFNFKQFGAGLGKAINSLFQNVDWASAARTLSDGVKGLLEGLTAAIKSVNWQMVGEKTAEFVSNIDWSGVGKAFLAGIGAAIKAIGDFIVGLFADPIARVGADMDPELKAAGADIAGGIIVGILEGLANIVMWIWDNVCCPIIDAVKKGFGIASPSKVMAEQGGYITAGLLQGITDSWGSITEFFGTAVSGIKEGLASGWNAIKETATSAWDGVKSAVTKPFRDTEKDLSTGVSKISTSMSSGWNGISANTMTAWRATQASVTQLFEQMKGKLCNTLSVLMTSISGGWNSVKTTAQSMWTSISSTVQGKWNDLQSVLRRTDWASIGSGICSGIRSGINAGWQWLKSTVSDLASSLLNSAKSALDIHSPSRVFRDEVGRNVGLGLAEGISDTEQNVAATVSNLAKTAVDAFGNPELTADVAGAEMVNGLDAVAERLTTIVDSFRAIASVLDSMGGLFVSDVMAGRIPTPPKIKTAVYTAEYNRTDYIGGSDVADRVISALVQVGEAIVKSIDEKDTSLVIGDDAIWDAYRRYDGKMSMIRG